MTLLVDTKCLYIFLSVYV